MPASAGQAPGLSIREALASDAAAVARLHTESWQSAYRGMLPDQYLDGTVPEKHRKRWRSLLGSPAVQDEKGAQDVKGGQGEKGAQDEEGAQGEEELERPDGVVRLAESEGQLLGFASVWFNHKPGYDAYVDNLHVRPGLRGGGIGKRLMRDAARQTAAAGYRSLSLEVLSENHAAIRFYERLGGAFRREDREEMGGVMVDYWLMVWDDVSTLAEGGD